MCIRDRRRGLVDEMVTSDVIAGVEAVEVALQFGEFRRAIARQRLFCLVGKALRTLGLQARGEIGSSRQFGRAARDVDPESVGILSLIHI